MLAEAGCSVAHNPVSNLKLGSGIAPWRKLLNAGVTVALGTDGISTNDAARMFDVMRFAGLIHNVTDPDYNLSLIHISEPPRLLSTSYAVFCLKKQTTHTHPPAPVFTLISVETAVRYAFPRTR